MTRALIPEGMETSPEALAASPGILSHGHVFVTGMTGSAEDGCMPDGVEAQALNAFTKIGRILGEAGLSSSDIVEMTTYHVGLRDHFDAFNRALRKHLDAPFPAWTAVEVAGLRREGALFEIRVIAALPKQ